MRITYVENVRIPSERAHAYQIVQTCAWLTHFGHTVTLVNPDRAGEQDVFSAYGLPQGVFRHERLRSWDPLSRWPVAKALAYVLQRWAFVRKLRQWAREYATDVWYTRDPAIVDALRGVVNGPWALELHDAPNANPDRWERIRPLVSRFVVISNGLKQRLLDEGIEEERILVAQDAFDPEQFRVFPERNAAREHLKVPEDAFVAVYAGGFYPWKGMDLVARSWDRVPENAWLVMAGGPLADRERVLAAVPASARDRTRSFPYLSRKDVIRLYAAADVGLLCSSPEHEIGRAFTSPLKLFEYLAAKLPVLASDVPSSHEILNDDVARFYEPTEQGFADAFRALQADADWRVRASELGPVLAAPYTWKVRVRKIETFLPRVGREDLGGLKESPKSPTMPQP